MTLGYVESQRDDGKSDQEIIARIMTKYGLTKEDATGVRSGTDVTDCLTEVLKTVKRKHEDGIKHREDE